MIRLIYTTANGKKVVKDFHEPMEIIGYIYRCWASARNAASTAKINAWLDAQTKIELDKAEEGGELT